MKTFRLFLIPSLPLFLAMQLSSAQETAIEALRAAISKEWPNMAALLVTKGEDLVFEFYGQGKNAASEAPLLSATEIVSGAVYGAAVAQGLAPAASARIEEALAKPRPGSPSFAKLTVSHFLTYTAGLAPFNVPWWEGEPLALIYRRRFLKEPGEAWSEEIECAEVLIHLVHRTSGGKSKEVAASCLFDPLGIPPPAWGLDGAGLYDGLQGLALRPPDLLKIARLYLTDGVYGGRRILPEGWAAEATRLQAAIPESLRLFPAIQGMGYLWWIVDTGASSGFAGLARGGSAADVPQLAIYGLPALDALVLMWNWGKPGSADSFASWFEFIDRAVLPVAR